MKIKNKKIIYFIFVSLLLISFAWLYILKLNIKSINGTQPKNGIGVSEFKTRLTELLNKSFSSPKKQNIQQQKPVITKNLVEKLSTELKNIDTQNNLVGNDKDEHGCIGSAGYIWSTTTQECIRPWEKNNQKVKGIKTIHTLPKL